MDWKIFVRSTYVHLSDLQCLSIHAEASVKSAKSGERSFASFNTAASFMTSQTASHTVAKQHKLFHANARINSSEFVSATAGAVMFALIRDCQKQETNLKFLAGYDNSIIRPPPLFFIMTLYLCCGQFRHLQTTKLSHARCGANNL
jgi:K+-transporting ATPase A subunit